MFQNQSWSQSALFTLTSAKTCRGNIYATSEIIL